jgi:hypothetical protein
VIGALTTLLIPAALAAYFLYQSIRRPIFFLGIPFLQVMRESIFFMNLRPFWVPGRAGTNLLILIWMVLAWSWCIVRSRAESGSKAPLASTRPARFLPAEYLLVTLAVLALAKLLAGSIGSTDTKVLINQFAPWCLLVVGYGLVRGVVRRSSAQDVAAFLVALAVATSIGAVLFILHQGLGITIYHVKEYAVFTFQGRTLTRTFWFYPPFLLVALAVGAALATGRVRRSQRLFAIIVVVICLVAAAVSYTRSEVIDAAVVIATILALRFYKERRLGPLLHRSLAIAAVVAVAAVILVVALPTPTQYLLSRMGTLTHSATALGDRNLVVRQSSVMDVGATVYDRSWLAGAPFGVADGMTRRIAVWTWDSTWAGVLYWTGFAGAVLIFGTFVLFGLRAVRLFLSPTESIEFLGAVYLASIIALLIATFFSWTFLNTFSYAMGFWLFAFVAGATFEGTDSGQGALDL